MTDEDFEMLRKGDKIVNYKTGIVYVVFDELVGGGCYTIVPSEIATDSDEWGKY